MDKKTLTALLDANAIKKINVIANGNLLYIQVVTANDKHSIETNAGKLKTWTSLDATARWLHTMGIGKLHIDIAKWHPYQRGLKIA